jgi:glycolate oxidase
MSVSITRDADVRESVATDASGLHLVPDAVARPSSFEETAELLRQASADRTSVTTAGGQTSTTGASITDRGILLSLRALDKIIDIDVDGRTARVEAGVLVSDLARAASEHGLLFAPDPTSEVESTVGGAVACNASGARTLMYGPTRKHVRALRVVLANGEIVSLRRPMLEKNTVGYALAHDPVDWFVGSEGTLGVILEIEFALLPKPEDIVGFALPFPTEEAALAFVAAARDSSTVLPRCLEYFDPKAAAIFQTGGATGPEDVSLPCVYAEQIVASGQDDAALDAWLALAETHNVSDGDIRVYQSEAALRDARRQRHSVPATMNERGNSFRSHGGRKVSTDWAVPYHSLTEAVQMARTTADSHGVEQAVLYGHAGNGHPHQNFVARNPVELEEIERVVEDTLKHIVGLGGTVAAEHGIGKLKRRWMTLQMSPLQVDMMRAVKNQLDPLGLLAPGNIL